MRRILLGLSLMVASFLAFSQGSTTSGMNGKVVDPAGEPIIGATVIAVNAATGAQYGDITDISGYFRIPNMKVGGTYNVTISFVGFTDYTQEGISLTLGKTFNLDVALQEGVQELSELVVTAGAGDIIDGNRTGAVTNVNTKQINSLPNASREMNDFIRLTPQASFTGEGGISIAGMNNRYNTIFIDGATSNDVFGLAGNGQNGGQVNGLSLISIDALEQLSVQVAPYDVTLGGFAGGGISAVTRSGTNEIQGSVYYFVRNDRLAGKTPGFIADDIEESTGEKFNGLKLGSYSAKTVGVRLGGPIIKDKLFFFINVEKQADETPAPFSFDSYTGAATQADIDNLLDVMDGFGYNPGSYQNTVSTLDAQKFLLKLDWNISDKHNLSIRHSYNKGESYSPATSNTSRINFANAGIFFPSTTNSSALELNSNFKEYSNKLILGFTKVEDDRDPIGSPFPSVSINTGRILFGSEPFSTANYLSQNIYTLTDNFTLFKGKHTWTFGTHNELYRMNNVFIPQNYGQYFYETVDDFIADVNGDPVVEAVDYVRSYSLVDNVTGDGSKAAAVFNAMQMGFYVQDEIQLNNKLKVNIGLRIDIPFFLDDPLNDGYFNEVAAPKIMAAGYDLKGAEAGKAPDGQVMVAPRFGFNYDLNGDGSTQIRGGAGIFTSRVPFVWPGAMYNNNGRTTGALGVSTDDGDVIDFNPDPFDQPTIADFGGTDAIPQGDMNLFAKDFKFPQVFRTSLGIDQKLPFWGLIATGEIIYTKNINNVFYENVNLQPSTDNFEGADNRARFLNGRVDGSYRYIILGSNTNEGFTTNYTIGLTKPEENGFSGSLFYNYGQSQAIFEGTSSQNTSQWRGVYAINGRNNAQLGVSDFSMGSRIIGTVSYRKEYLGMLATTVSLVYNGQSGQVFSYTYDEGRFTGEDSRERALIYVPNDASEIVFDESDWSAEEQWIALNNYIESDDYLKTRRGQYAVKNQNRTPFTSIFDFRLLQDIFVSTGDKRNTLQLSLDIFNFGNMLNTDWGKRYFVPDGSGTSVQLLDYKATVSNVPTFAFDPSKEKMEDFLGKDDSGLISSRWQMQLGIRYIFN